MPFTFESAGDQVGTRSAVKADIKRVLSLHDIANEIFQVAEIPRTLSGKKQELPHGVAPAGLRLASGRVVKVGAARAQRCWLPRPNGDPVQGL